MSKATELVYADSRDFLYVDGVKVGRVVGPYIEFFDKDPKRSRERGSCYVLVEVDVLYQKIKAICGVVDK